RVLTAMLFAALLVSKWHELTRHLGVNRPPTGDLIAWGGTLYFLLQIPFLALMVLLVVVRRPVQVGTARASGILAALAGTAAPMFLVYESDATSHALLAPLAVALLLAGMGWAIWSLATLGRCFSLLPEVRGLVTGGPYRWVRHPVYLGEIIATLGVLLPILSPVHVAIFAGFCAVQLWRTRHEETALAATFPEYDDYRRRTARLLPALW
ncbi:MAG TPA: isoprenylcysteine carboxylmethyltransferase family protein, partial [Thermomicrobiaceae bacterium]|nr:isoprenylcysteine carboxylmethyltransferase family protein [Thermomicrobiaceae bacterium]